MNKMGEFQKTVTNKVPHRKSDCCGSWSPKADLNEIPGAGWFHPDPAGCSAAMSRTRLVGHPTRRGTEPDLNDHDLIVARHSNRHTTRGRASC